MQKSLIGVVHVGALPGTPSAKDSLENVIKKAVAEASALQATGFDSIIIENMHDRPYLNRTAGPEIIASMTAIALAIKKVTTLPLGIQILAGANNAALAVAHAANANFIRAEGFVFGHVADEGWIDACAGELLRYRKTIGAEHIAIYTDIKKKHAAHATTQDVSILETAKAAEFFLANGVIVSGPATGTPADINELKSLNHQLHIPVLIGSGITSDNLASYFPLADAFIVGSSIKQDGHWANELDPAAMKKLVTTFQQLKSKVL